MTQVFYPYTVLEEHEAGLWQAAPIGDRERLIEAAAALMRDTGRFLDAMMLAIAEWPRSMEAAMTTPSLNQRAWMGHAGCCIALGSPEDLTRLGWHRLTKEEQDLANDAADQAIERWRDHAVDAIPSRSLWDA